MASASLQHQLDAPFELSPDQIASYREHGFVRLKNVLSPDLLAHYRAAIERQVQLAAVAQPLDEQLAKDQADDSYARAFTQVINTCTRTHA